MGAVQEVAATVTVRPDGTIGLNETARATLGAVVNVIAAERGARSPSGHAVASRFGPAPPQGERRC